MLDIKVLLDATQLVDCNKETTRRLLSFLSPRGQGNMRSSSVDAVDIFVLEGPPTIWRCWFNSTEGLFAIDIENPTLEDDEDCDHEDCTGEDCVSDGAGRALDNMLRALKTYTWSVTETSEYTKIFLGRQGLFGYQTETLLASKLTVLKKPVASENIAACKTCGGTTFNVQTFASFKGTLHENKNDVLCLSRDTVAVRRASAAVCETCHAPYDIGKMTVNVK